MTLQGPIQILCMFFCGKQALPTIIEGLVMEHGLYSCFKELEEGLGVTRWQCNNAQLGIVEFAHGKKEKAAQSVAMKVEKAIGEVC